jgi:hypothetical protein
MKQNPTLFKIIQQNPAAHDAKFIIYKKSISFLTGKNN